jgi:hypothetical protein
MSKSCCADFSTVLIFQQCWAFVKAQSLSTLAAAPLLLAVLTALGGCANASKRAMALPSVATLPRTGSDSSQAPPALVVGDFEDDYGNRFSISPDLWIQHPRARYLVVRWRPVEQYAIARNDIANPSDGGKWTRIDWMPLTGYPPYRWAFCLSAYRAPTAESAESTTIADRSAPKIGCGGHPFSRMRPVEGSR